MKFTNTTARDIDINLTDGSRYTSPAGGSVTVPDAKALLVNNSQATLNAVIAGILTATTDAGGALVLPTVFTPALQLISLNNAPNAAYDRASKQVLANSGVHTQKADAFSADDLGRAAVAQTAVAARASFLASTQFSESWSNIAAWSKTSGAADILQVGASPSGYQPSGSWGYAAASATIVAANNSFVVAGGAPARVVVRLRAVFSNNNSSVIFGFSNDAAGAAAGNGATSVKGLCFNQPSSGGNTVQRWIGSGTGGGDGATSNIITGLSVPYIDWIVSVVVDATTISMVARSTSLVANGQQAQEIEARATFLRAGFNINNIAIFNNDTRGTAGTGFGPIQWRNAITNQKPIATNEATGYRVQYLNDGTNQVRIALPKNYDALVPTPVVLFFHGRGGDATAYSPTPGAGISVDANSPLPEIAFLDAGYIVVSANLVANRSTWGAQGSIDAYWFAAQYVRANYTTGAMTFFTGSMGSLEGSNALADPRFVNVVAMICSNPYVNLAVAYQDVATYQGDINTAYNIPGGGSYAVQTAGRDPMLMPITNFRGIPISIWSALDDTVAVKSLNADPFAAKLAASNTVTLNPVPAGLGGHSFTLTPYLPAMIQFADKYSKAVA